MRRQERNESMHADKESEVEGHAFEICVSAREWRLLENSVVLRNKGATG